MVIARFVTVIWNNWQTQNRLQKCCLRVVYGRILLMLSSVERSFASSILLYKLSCNPAMKIAVDFFRSNYFHVPVLVQLVESIKMLLFVNWPTIKVIQSNLSTMRTLSPHMVPCRETAELEITWNGSVWLENFWKKHRSAFEGDRSIVTNRLIALLLSCRFSIMWGIWGKELEMMRAIFLGLRGKCRSISQPLVRLVNLIKWTRCSQSINRWSILIDNNRYQSKIGTDCR